MPNPDQVLFSDRLIQRVIRGAETRGLGDAFRLDLWHGDSSAIGSTGKSPGGQV